MWRLFFVLFNRTLVTKKWIKLNYTLQNEIKGTCFVFKTKKNTQQPNEQKAIDWASGFVNM